MSDATGGGDAGAGGAAPSVFEQEGISTEGFTPDEIAELSGEDTGSEESGDDVVVEDAPADAAKASDAAKAADDAATERTAAGERGKPPPDGFVPIKALHETRDELRTMRDTNQQLQDRLNGLVDTIRERSAQTKQQQPQQDQQPMSEADRQRMELINGPDVSFAENPELAHTQATLRQQHLRDQINSIRQESQQTVQHRQQEVADNSMLDAVAQYRHETASRDPEVSQAIDHIVNSTAEALKRRGFDGPQLQQYMRQQVLQFAKQAPESDAQLRQYVLNAAADWGYNYDANAAQQQPADGSGQANAGGDKALDRMAAIQAASKTLSGGGAGGSDAELTSDDLANMSGAELDALIMKNADLFEEAANR